MSPTRTYLRGVLAGALAVHVARNVVELAAERRAILGALDHVRGMLSGAAGDLLAAEAVREADRATRAAAMRRHPSSGGKG